MSVRQMGDDLAPSFVDSLGKGGTAKGFMGQEPRQAPKVEPFPSIDDVLLSPEPSPGFTGDALSPVTSTPGGSNVVGDQVSGYPRDGVSQEAARVGPGDMISDYEIESGGPEDTDSATGREPGYDKAVGDMTTGMPRDDFPGEQYALAQVAPEGLVTGQVKGGYAPGTNQPTSLDRGVAGPA